MRDKVVIVIALVLLVPSPIVPHAAEPHGKGPSVSQAMSAFVVHDEVKVSLAAREPNVVDPVAIRFDCRGRMWVVEMRDYPTGPINGADFDGRIKVLTDEDQDGLFESSTLFADGLIFPTGLQPWREGVIVTLSGKIEYLADTDGDGQCDLRETWFEGFAEENEQLRANHPVLGPDGMVYVAGGLRGGKIRSTDPRWVSDESFVDITRSDFAFDPQGGFFGAVAGTSQYGLSIDDFGNRVGCSNRNPAIETILEMDEIHRDRWSSPKDALHDIANAASESYVAAITDSWTTSHTHAGQFSAACGVTVGMGTRLPASWRDDLVVCEPTAYAVQRQRISDDGTTRSSKRIDRVHELMSSRNDWFRPVDTIIGIDGALYVVDMCRAVIEHPRWAPAELKERPDERWGNDLGRIWRLVEPCGSNGASLVSAETSPQVWIDRLNHANPAVRQLATQWLVEKDQASLNPQLLHAWGDRSSRTEAGLSRLAQVLDRHGLLTATMVKEMARHDSNRIRRLSTRLLRDHSLDWPLLSALLDDEHAGVRFDAIRLAGCWSNQLKDAGTLRLAAAKISRLIRQNRGIDDDRPYWLTRLACLPPDLAATIAVELVNTEEEINNNADVPESWDVSVLFRLCRSAALNRAFAEPLSTATHSRNRDPQVDHAIVFAAAWSQAHRTAGRAPVQMLEQVRDRTTKRLLETAKLAANQVVGDSSRTSEIRLYAIDAIVGFGMEDWDHLLNLLEDRVHRDLHARVIPLLFGRSAIDPLLRSSLLEWFDRKSSSMTVELQRLTLDQMVRHPILMSELLDRLDQRRLPTALLSVQQTKRLLNVKDGKIAKRAAGLLQAARQDRLAVIQDYQTSISDIADLEQGQTQFRQHCAACHRISDVGVHVGPDISDSRTKTPAYLLTAILDPNAAVDAGFMGHQVLTLDGEMVTGTLLTNAAGHVTLQVNGGERKTIDRAEIEVMKSTGKSMMPEGFEGGLSPDQMRDLIGYLKGWRYYEQGQVTLDLDRAQ